MRKILLLLALSLTAQTMRAGPAGPYVLSEVDDSDQPYAINVPTLTLLRSNGRW